MSPLKGVGAGHRDGSDQARFLTLPPAAPVFATQPTQHRADRIESLAKQLSLPNSVTGTVDLLSSQHTNTELKVQSFVDPDPFQELTFTTVIAAKLAIADYLGRPLAKLTPEQMAYVDSILGNTLNKQAVMSQVRDYFHPKGGRQNAE